MYGLYKETFITFAVKHYAIDKSTATDIYQESFLVLYQNLKNGKYVEQGNSLKTYLFQIGKYKICHYLRFKFKEAELLDYIITDREEPAYEKDEWLQIQELACQLVLEADTKCSRILTLYYWEKKKMTEIAQAMNYKTSQTAKNKKSSCMRRFIHELKKRLNQSGIDWKI